MADLAEIPTEDLMKEVQRRLQCQQKPEKRLILVGKNQHLLKKRETRDERREREMRLLAQARMEAAKEVMARLDYSPRKGDIRLR